MEYSDLSSSQYGHGQKYRGDMIFPWTRVYPGNEIVTTPVQICDCQYLSFSLDKRLSAVREPLTQTLSNRFYF